ncbi:MAG: phospholipase [Syntrophus sp. (in: bacteria)]|nr:phospholipase [Syntrophus sp. (in: bacteria)]
MVNRLNGSIRRIAPFTALLILFVAQAAVVADPGTKAHVPVSPAGCDTRLLIDQDYLPALLEGIDQARREIALSVFFFKTNGFKDHQPDRVLSHLREAARRGVKVDVVIEQGKERDSVSGANAETVKKLKAAGIEICMDGPDKTTHAKMVIIDRRYLFIGSHNLTQSALKYNHEVSVRIDSPSLAEEGLRYMKSICPR